MADRFAFRDFKLTPVSHSEFFLTMLHCPPDASTCDTYMMSTERREPESSQRRRTSRLFASFGMDYANALLFNIQVERDKEAAEQDAETRQKGALQYIFRKAN